MVGCYFEFFVVVVESNEFEYVEKEFDGFGRDVFDGVDVDGLGVVVELVVKVDVGDY